MTEKQSRVAELVAQALTDKEIAARLGVPETVVRGLVRRAYQALDIPMSSNRRVALALKLQKVLDERASV